MELITLSENPVSDEVICSYKKLIEKRKNGIPVAYLTGAKEFWSLELNVTEDTLIPRPETELLVESALQLIGRNAQCRVLDLGTGTGAIAIAIASSRPEVTVIGTDNSKAALQVAIENSHNHKVTNVTFSHSDWFENMGGQCFDLIVSNPPYIKAGDSHLQHGEIKFEPTSALVSGKQGLDDLKVIITQASGFLNDGGWLLAEHGHDQSAAVSLLFRDSGFKNIETINDLSRIPRVTMGQTKI